MTGCLPWATLPLWTWQLWVMVGGAVWRGTVQTAQEEPALMSNQPPQSCAQACRKFSGATAGIPTPGFISEREEALPQTPPFLPTLLSQGWTWHSPSCYWLGEDQVTYSEARRLCTDHGSQLVTITNRYERGTSPPLCPGRMRSLHQKGQQPAIKSRGT